MTAATGNATLHVGAAQPLGPLTLFPVWSDAEASTGHHTHAEATSALQITERQQPTVSWLTVTNTSHRPVLLLDGELLAGGSQDRISTATHLLAPQTTTDLPVACVEPGRWAPGAAGLQRVGHATPALRAGNHRSLARSRSRHSSTGDQAGTWREVARLRGHSGAPAPTGSLTDVDRHVRRHHTSRPIPPRPLDGQRGLLIGHGGRIRSLDLLASHRDLAAYWQPLLQAAWLEASAGPTIPVRSGQARRFVTQLCRLRYLPRPSRGLGQDLRATGPGITAAALHHRGQLIHLSAFDLTLGA